ncbi:MAG TPA: nitroreductase family protein, partial [bacterium]|nr:nitroreductase family protein [bacterium]
RRDFRKQSLPNPESPEVKPALQKIIDDTVNTPVIIIIASRGHADPELQEENYWATFGAVYAFMLAAWAEGLGTYFRSGPIREYAPLRQMLNLEGDQRIIGVLYVGYPAMVPQKQRTPGAAKTAWLD